jgi:hypothetical protein
MPVRNFICLFDLPPYDRNVAPALRRYARDYDPEPVVALLHEIMQLLPTLRQDTGRVVLDRQDYEHWIDSIAPDAGHKPSEQTVRELSDMVVQQLCIPHGLGLNGMQDIDPFVPWLTEQSEWFADLIDGGEELAGGRLEFTLGTGSLIATRQQISQFLNEVRTVGPPSGASAGLSSDYRNLSRLLEAADSNASFTLLKTSLK